MLAVTDTLVGGNVPEENGLIVAILWWLLVWLLLCYDCWFDCCYTMMTVGLIVAILWLLVWLLLCYDDCWFDCCYAMIVGLIVAMLWWLLVWLLLCCDCWFYCCYRGSFWLCLKDARGTWGMRRGVSDPTRPKIAWRRLFICTTATLLFTFGTLPCVCFWRTVWRMQIFLLCHRKVLDLTLHVC